MSPNLLDDDVGDVLAAAFAERDGDVQVVNPSRETIPKLVSCLDELPDPPSVRLLADERPLKDVMEDFITASHAADLVEAGTLSIRLLEEIPKSSLLVGDRAVTSVVSAGDQVAGLRSEDEQFVSKTREHYDSRWAEADEFSLRTPPLSAVMETLSAEIGEDAAADLEQMLDELTVARGDGAGLDEVTLTLLVAARNGELLYDISKWGEDVGLASKATFSRTKTALEDEGLIDTEKVPIDVGRPRLRLRLGDDRLLDADAAELVHVAQEMLAA